MRALAFAFENARPRPWSEIKGPLEGLNAHLESVEEAPLACASIGQVHRGVLKVPRRRRTGGYFTKVAVKVIYPDVRRNLVQDLKNQRVLADRVNDAGRGVTTRRAVDFPGGRRGLGIPRRASRGGCVPGGRRESPLYSAETSTHEVSFVGPR